MKLAFALKLASLSMPGKNHRVASNCYAILFSLSIALEALLEELFCSIVCHGQIAACSAKNSRKSEQSMLIYSLVL